MRQSITTSMTLPNALAPAMRLDARVWANVWLMTTTTSMTFTTSYIGERLE